MGYLEYDAIAVGEQDLNCGLEALLKDRDRCGLNLICANLFQKVGQTQGRKAEELKRPFPAFRIVSKNGVKIGFIAILSPATKGLRDLQPGSSVEALTYVIKDPAPIARRLVPKVREKCDVLVLLAHMERAELETLLPELPEVDMVVLGHSGTRSTSKEPLLIGTVPVYMAAPQGQYVGCLRVTLDPSGRIVDSSNEMYYLDRTRPDDPVLAEIVKAFEEEYRTIQKELYAKEMLRGSQASSGAQNIYLGIGACHRCHTDAFETYTRTAHARAYETLASQFMHRDSNCIGCHSTGYGEPGGFSGARVIGSMVDLVDVQCESCHGPGAEHSRDGSYLRKAAKSCTKCHDQEQDPNFDFAEAWQKIAH